MNDSLLTIMRMARFVDGVLLREYSMVWYGDQTFWKGILKPKEKSANGHVHYHMVIEIDAIFSNFSLLFASGIRT